MVTEVYKITNEYYREDRGGPVRGPSLRQSLVSDLLDGSPAAARRSYLSGIRGDGPARLEYGSAVHSLVLGGPRVVRMPEEYADWRSKAAQQSRAAARAEGYIPLLPHEHDAAVGDATRVTELLRRLLGSGAHRSTEVPLLWRRDGDPWCRARLDMVVPAMRMVVDLKTTSHTRHEWARGLPARYGYHVQAAAYTDAAAAWWGCEPEDVTYCLVIVPPEPEPAWVARLSGTYLDLGRKRWQAAKRLWSRCASTGSWPEAPESVELEAPAWLIHQTEEYYADA